MHEKKCPELTPEALQVLIAYPWPGNVRELRNLIERVIILTPENEEGRPLQASTLLTHLREDSFALREEESPLFTASGSPAGADAPARSLKDARQEFEREFILQTLKKLDWNVSKAAQALGIERSHLHRKIKSFGIEE